MELAFSLDLIDLVVGFKPANRLFRMISVGSLSAEMEHSPQVFDVQFFSYLLVSRARNIELCT